MIGIIGAMEEEVAHLVKLCEEREEIVQGPYRFYKGRLSGKDVVLVRAGVGKCNAAACTQALIDRFQPSYIFNIGIAGAISPEVHILDLVISRDALQYDVDVTRFDYPLGKVPGDEKLGYDADPRLLEIAVEVNQEINPEHNSYIGRVVTGDRFVSSHETKEYLKKTFDATCCEMEGAAIAQIATKNGIPFVILRFISDEANDEASMVYEEFEAKAIEKTVDFMLELLRRV